MSRPKGHSRAPISEQKVARIRADLAHGIGVERIAAQRQVSKMTVYRIRDAKPPVQYPEPPRFELVAVEPVPRPLTPRELYAVEKEKRAERLKADAKIAEAKAEFQRQLEAQRAAGKGGRPKKDAPNVVTIKPGKPRVFAHRVDPLDLCPFLGHYSGEQR